MIPSFPPPFVLSPTSLRGNAHCLATLPRKGTQNPKSEPCGLQWLVAWATAVSCARKLFPKVFESYQALLYSNHFVTNTRRHEL